MITREERLSPERLIQDQTRANRLSQALEAILYVGAISSAVFFGALGVLSLLVIAGRLL